MNKSVKTLVVLSILFLSLLSAYTLRKPDKQIFSAPFDIKVFEDHRDALEHWAKKEFRDAVLVNIDAHDDIQMVSTENMNRLKEISQKTVNSGLGGHNFSENESISPLITNSNFINAAVKLGIIKRVVWIVPSTFDLFQDNSMQLVSLLKAYGFQKEDINTFKMKGECFRGRAFEVPLDICDINSLPYLNEPVLLSIDADYFPLAVSGNNYKITKSIQNTVNRIFSKGYTIQDAVVAYSVNGGFLNTTHRWVGDLAADLLRSPEMRAESELPEKYAVLQSVDLLLTMKRHKDLLDYLLPYLKKDEKNPAINMYVAKAYHELGEIDKSFAYAEKACLAENNYCYGLPELGSNILDDHGLASAERFFVRGYEMCPKMDYRQFRFAMKLKQSGRYKDAIKYFKVFRDLHGSFPVDLYIAEAYLLIGDEISALKYFDSARTELLQNPNALASFGDLSTIKRAVSFYEEKGLNKSAEELNQIMKPGHINAINFSM
ncbi:MAG: hypothetical protein A2X59_02340 [Nitrospirae bacterium GWC2_42_7]|nr:MAG: hypothetical protein A2X59_02340 [Nitrospirae bacterium GWC2_42_7]